MASWFQGEMAERKASVDTDPRPAMGRAVVAGARLGLAFRAKSCLAFLIWWHFFLISGAQRK